MFDLHRRTRAFIRASTLGALVAVALGCPVDKDKKQQGKPVPVAVDDVRYRVPLLPQEYALGGEHPLVTIVVFADYACPPCGRTWQVMHNLVQDYGDDVRVVFRSYTVPGFGKGEQAAEAAFTAGAQGKFWEMHWRLFEHAPAFDRPTLRSHAEALDLDVDKFMDELDTGAHAGKRIRHRRQAKQLGIIGLPASFINGRFVSGFVDEASWHALVDQEIALGKKKLAEGVRRDALYDGYMKEAVAHRVGVPKGAQGLQDELAKKQEADEAKAGKSLERPKPGQRYRIDAHEAPSIGPQDAPVLVVAFLDYACPYCRRAWNSELDQLIDARKDGVRFAVRHLPLEIHPTAKGAAIAAMAAHQQGKFWEFNDLLLRHEGTLGRDVFVGYAKKLGLDDEKFLAALDDPALAERVEADMELGMHVGVTGTPGFFVNGRYARGFEPGRLAGMIDEEFEHAKKLQEQGVEPEQVVSHVMDEAIAPKDFPNR